MIKRNLEGVLKSYSREYPIIAVVGPRQSGKTTLVRSFFKEYNYITLESMDNRERVNSDPRGFLEDIGKRVILDEIQRVPSLFSYLQEYADRDPEPAQYILTGSNQFLLMEKIAQSLAGRIITFKLFPFTANEIYYKREDRSLKDLYTPIETRNKLGQDLVDVILKGMYPRIHDKKLTPRRWVESYLETYVERDVRSLVNVSDLRIFENFLKVAASYSGQLLNYAGISNRIGVSQPTVKEWISVLETSGIVFILSPHYQNFSKRIVKTPKLYFIDTAVLCYLLSIKSAEHLLLHPLYGNIFETFIISEFYKRIMHIGEKPPLYFWRDKTGNEIDLIIEDGLTLIPIEIKLSRTFSSSYFKNMERWFALKGNNNEKGFCIYTGDTIIGKRKTIGVYPWYAF